MNDRRLKRRRYDAARQGSAPRGWYKSPVWFRKRRNQLRAEPYCRMHRTERDELVVATVADHVIPHRGDYMVFWHGELQSLCKACHDRRKQSDERAGFSSAIGADGWPTDDAHPVNRPLHGETT